MRTVLIAAASLTALTGVAFAQPPGRGPGPGGGFGMLSLDANADGRITRAELDAAQRTRFDAIDANHDGFATPEEFRASHEKERAAHLDEMINHRFTALDADGNGQISKAEFAASMKPDHQADKGRRGPEREFRARGPGRGPGMRQDRSPDGAAARLGPDSDKDGKVSLAEFSAHAVEAFNKADQNKDGVVTIAELQAAAPARR